MRQKWHTAHRNLKIGDIVLIQDSNLVRGQWRLGIVSNTYLGSDGKVRKVEVQYKNPKQGEPVTKCHDQMPCTPFSVTYTKG